MALPPSLLRLNHKLAGSPWNKRRPVMLARDPEYRTSSDFAPPPMLGDYPCAVIQRVSGSYYYTGAPNSLEGREECFGVMPLGVHAITSLLRAIGPLAVAEGFRRGLIRRRGVEFWLTHLPMARWIASLPYEESVMCDLLFLSLSDWPRYTEGLSEQKMDLQLHVVRRLREAPWWLTERLTARPGRRPLDRQVNSR